MYKDMKGSITLIYLLIFLLLAESCARYQSPDMVLISGGTFMMGSPADEYDRDTDEARRQVTVNSFFISKYEVSQKEYQGIMRTNPSGFKGNKLPVENVSWFDALNFCNRLSIREGLNPVYIYSGNEIIWDRNADGYRLPTEAEWEYACRAGTDTPFNTGANITSDQVNYDGNFPYIGDTAGGLAGDRYEKFLEKTMPIGSYKANAFGLFDMHGNVFEWCWDWYDYYSHEDRTNPVGPASGSFRVIRGGSWINSGVVLRSAYRGIHFPDGGGDRIGIRLVRNAQ